MKRKITIILSFVLAIAALLGAAGCGQNKQSELQSQIDAQQNQITELQSKTDEQQSKIEELENENERLKDNIINLAQDFLLENCTFISLEKAYDYGLIDRNDVKHICYFHCGAVYEDVYKSDIDMYVPVEIEFTPDKQLTELDAATEELIKLKYYNQFPERFRDGEGTEILEVNFFGKYNFCYAVRVDSDNWIHGLGAYPVSVGGITWSEFGPEIQIFYYKQ